MTAGGELSGEGSGPPLPGAQRRIPAPGLRETAEIWWEAESDPVVEWDGAGRRIWLVDMGDSAHRLLLWRSTEPMADPRGVATALAEGLASCDFPPTGDGVSRPRAEATLRAAGCDPDGRRGRRGG